LEAQTGLGGRGNYRGWAQRGSPKAPFPLGNFGETPTGFTKSHEEIERWALFAENFISYLVKRLADSSVKHLRGHLSSYNKGFEETLRHLGSTELLGALALFFTIGTGF